MAKIREPVKIIKKPEIKILLHLLILTLSSLIRHRLRLRQLADRPNPKMSQIVKLAQFKVPGGSAGSQDLVAPAGIPKALQGGLENSGTAFFQTIVNNLII